MTKISISRRGIPECYRDLTNWPSVDFNAMPDEKRKKYQANEEAVQLYIDHPEIKIAEISERTGVPTTQILRLVARCLQTHKDGRIHGFRGLIPQSRIKQYQLTKPPNDTPKHKSKGTAGAFQFLLQKYPVLDEFIMSRVKAALGKGRSISDKSLNVRQVHAEFIRRCRKLGIAEDDYPLNQEYLGSRSLNTYIKKLISEHPALVAAGKGKRLQGIWIEDNPLKPSAMIPYQIVEIDGHKLDLRLTVSITDQFGCASKIEITRIWVVVIKDIVSRAILGYQLVLAPEYGRQDIIEAVQNALKPHQKHKLTIPKLEYSEEGGFPNAVFPELAYACWDIIRLDNAAAHLSEQALSALSQFVGCWPEFGPPGEPNDRPFIESFFNMLARHFAHRVPGTTGSHPFDAVRSIADPNGDLSLLMTYDELEELIDVWIWSLNGRPHPSLNNRSPLEFLRHCLSAGKLQVRNLARVRQSTMFLMGEAKRVQVKGKAESGKRPYINFENVKYSNEVLSRSTGLVNKYLNIYFNSKDLRQVHAFFEDGSELGILTAARPWCFTPHTLKMRKEIFKLRRKGALKVEEEDDPVEIYIAYKTKRATRDKRSATTVAQAQKAKDVQNSVTSQVPVAPEFTKENKPTKKSRGKAPLPADDLPLSYAELEPEPLPATLTVKRTVIY